MPLPTFPDPPLFNAGFGVATEYGTLLPPGSRPVYVCNAGSSYGSTDRLAGVAFPTLAAGLAECRSGLADTVIVLPGHQENVVDATMLTNLVAGTRIIGLGSPVQSNAPTFTWTNTAGSWAVSVADVFIYGLRFLCDAANGITTAFNITASGCTISDSYISLAAGAALKSTIGITIGSAAHDCRIIRNYITGTETHNVTDGIKVLGATPPARVNVSSNCIIASATAANGLVHFTVASKRSYVGYNTIYNTHTSSTACIVYDDVAVDGIAEYNNLAVMNDGTANAQGITFGTSATVKCIQNFDVDEPKKSGVLAPAAAT